MVLVMVSLNLNHTVNYSTSFNITNCKMAINKHKLVVNCMRCYIKLLQKVIGKYLKLTHSHHVIDVEDDFLVVL